MKSNLKRLIPLFAIFFCCIFFTFCFFNLLKGKSTYTSTLPAVNPNTLTIHYIDVGQGDCELIQFDNKNMLIDAGPADAADKVISYLKKYKVTELDYLIETHPHEDHIGGMSLVLKNFNVKNFIAPKLYNNSTTAAYKQLLQNIREKSISIFSPAPGYFIKLSSKMQCEVLAPGNTYYEDLNNYSIVIKLMYNNCKFLFMGDAQSESENQMLLQNFDLSCNVIKVGHHGSKTASSANFLKETGPNIAIISCDKENDFGHPHKVVLERYKALGCKVYRTDLNGDIVLTADGTTIKVYTATH